MTPRQWRHGRKPLILTLLDLAVEMAKTWAGRRRRTPPHQIPIRWRHGRRRRAALQMVHLRCGPFGIILLCCSTRMLASGQAAAEANPRAAGGEEAGGARRRARRSRGQDSVAIRIVFQVTVTHRRLAWRGITKRRFPWIQMHRLKEVRWLVADRREDFLASYMLRAMLSRRAH